MHWSTHFQRQRPTLKAGVWGGTRVLGVSPKVSAGAACVYWACLKLSGKKTSCYFSVIVEEDYSGNRTATHQPLTCWM